MGRRWRSLPKRALRRSGHALVATNREARDRRRSSFLGESAPQLRRLGLTIPIATNSARELAGVAPLYLQHHFDLLGSGWVEVRHGMSCRGVEGHRYRPRPLADPDSPGAWLDGLVSRPNVSESRRIWQMLDETYTPIDWQRDFKSGWRWSEHTWYGRIRYGHHAGVDIKVPWELARMQHLPQLALAYALARNGAPGFAEPELYGAEFRNEVLDFVATNSTEVRGELVRGDGVRHPRDQLDRRARAVPIRRRHLRPSVRVAARAFALRTRPTHPGQPGMERHRPREPLSLGHRGIALDRDSPRGVSRDRPMAPIRRPRVPARGRATVPPRRVELRGVDQLPPPVR